MVTIVNDFTKEELEDIFEAVMDTCISMPIYLPYKIKSMIYNYCEHKNVKIDVPMEQCQDCGAHC